jgi:hypothetical protein
VASQHVTSNPADRAIGTVRAERLCAANVDRLTFIGQIDETSTSSYRLAHARAQRSSS